MKKYFVLLTLLVPLNSVFAAVVDHDRMYKAYLANDMATWGRLLSEYVSIDTLTIEDKIDMSNYFYGYIATILKTEKKEHVERLISIWEGYLEDIEKSGVNSSTIHVYLSSIAAYRTSLYPMKALSYVKESLLELDLAKTINPENPLVVGLQGNVLFYMPKIMGGDKKKALECFQKAVRLHEENPNILYRWNECGIRLCLAQAYEKLDRKQEAIEVCRKTLEIVPDFSFMRDIYLPELLSRDKK